MKGRDAGRVKAAQLGLALNSELWALVASRNLSNSRLVNEVAAASNDVKFSAAEGRWKAGGAAAAAPADEAGAEALQGDDSNNILK
jgi:hypothetical protein